MAFPFRRLDAFDLQNLMFYRVQAGFCSFTWPPLVMTKQWFDPQEI